MYNCSHNSTIDGDHRDSSARFAEIIRPLQRGAVFGIVLMGAIACASEDSAQSDLADNLRSTGISEPARGYAYAKANCASCHALDAGQIRSPNPAAPTFESLANRPDMTRMTLSALLRLPHRNMPNLVVEPDAIDDLSAYLSTLRNNHEPV